MGGGIMFDEPVWLELRAEIIRSIFEPPIKAWFTPTPEERPMLYEVAIVNVDTDGNVTGIAMPITAVVAEDRDAAIVEATRKLGGDGTVVDTKAIRVLVRGFPG